MSTNLEEQTGDTVRILRPPPRVTTDPLGRNVWLGEIEPLELALEDSTNSDPYNSAEVTGHSLLPVGNLDS